MFTVWVLRTLKCNIGFMVHCEFFFYWFASYNSTLLRVTILRQSHSLFLIHCQSKKVSLLIYDNWVCAGQMENFVKGFWNFKKYALFIGLSMLGTCWCIQEILEDNELRFIFVEVVLSLLSNTGSPICLLIFCFNSFIHFTDFKLTFLFGV